MTDELIELAQYVIRHQSIYGNSDIIAQIFLTLFRSPVLFIQFLDSPCTTGDCHSTIGHVANPCEYISISINIVKRYIGIKQQALVISPSKAIFERNAVIAQPPGILFLLK